MAHVSISQQDQRIGNIEKENIHLRETLEVYAGQIERNTKILHQVITGLFDRHILYQGDTLDYFVNKLHGAPTHNDFELVYPTTRQGNEHEKRLTDLEKHVEELDKEVHHLWVEKDERLTAIEDRLLQLEEQIDAMEQRQIEKYGLTIQ